MALSWMWGLGLFFSVQMTFMFGLQGLLMFAVPNAMGLILFGFLTQKVDCLKVDGVVIASVVPTLTGIINSAIKKFLSDEITNKTFIISDNKNRLNIDIKINNKICFQKKINGKSRTIKKWFPYQELIFLI